MKNKFIHIVSMYCRYFEEFHIDEAVTSSLTFKMNEIKMYKLNAISKDKELSAMAKEFNKPTATLKIVTITKFDNNFIHISII